MISVMESVLREATVHESWSPHLRMQIKSSPIRGGGGLVELASSTSYLGNNMNPGDSSSPNLAETPGFRDQESPQTTMDNRMKKSKNHRDPTSHRVIEKRRRDRMNNCLTNLSKLIPLAYLKKGRGRIEKTEIIEMAIRYMKHVDLERRQQLKRENMHLQEEFMLDKGVGTTDDQFITISQGPAISSPDSTKPSNDRYKQGFFDCVAETVRFLVGAEGLIVNEQIKTKLLLHLRDYFTGLACGSTDSKMNELKLNNCTINQHEDYADDEEPLNMSIKRPRPSNDIIRCGQWTGVGGSQLRGILESKDNHTAVTSSSSSTSTFSSMKLLSPTDLNNKIEIKNENGYAPSTTTNGNGAVPRSAPQALGAQIQHRFTSILEQPAAFLMPKPQINGGAFSSQSSSSTQYPSSPSSSTSYCTDSPPEAHSPATTSNNGVSVPVFALHPLGLFYVPMIVNSNYLDSNFQNLLTSSFVERSSAEHVQSSLALSHPVTISVNFNLSTYNGAVNHENQQRLERSHTVQQSSVILTTSSLSRSALQ